MTTVTNGLHHGRVTAPRSKSHEHRLLIADFLAGDDSRLVEREGDSADIAATKRCLRMLRTDEESPLLDCGESGSTRRFLGPVAAALGKRPVFKMSGRLGMRPNLEYNELRPGEFRLDGGVSSQFVTGLLFALPLLDGDSYIRFSAPLESRGYVDMTLRVLAGAGIFVSLADDGYDIPGSQVYHSQKDVQVEGDWSGAAFWYAMNALGSMMIVEGLNPKSAQPDRVVSELLRRISTGWTGEKIGIDVSSCPDIFPVLAVVAAGSPVKTIFTGTRRLRLKESDRVEAMTDVLGRFGVKVEQEDNSFIVTGTERQFAAGEYSSFGDHRIAMSIAVGATRASGPLVIDDVECSAKSYPDFFSEFNRTLG